MKGESIEQLLCLVYHWLLAILTISASYTKPGDCEIVHILVNASTPGFCRHSENPIALEYSRRGPLNGGYEHEESSRIPCTHPHLTLPLAVADDFKATAMGHLERKLAENNNNSTFVFCWVLSKHTIPYIRWSRVKRRKSRALMKRYDPIVEVIGGGRYFLTHVVLPLSRTQLRNCYSCMATPGKHGPFYTYTPTPKPVLMDSAAVLLSNGSTDIIGQINEGHSGDGIFGDVERYLSDSNMKLCSLCQQRVFDLLRLFKNASTFCREKCFDHKLRSCSEMWYKLDEVGWRQSDYPFDCQILPRCLRKDSCEYNGSVNITRIGERCQQWNSQTPLEHRFVPDIYPELEGNACRNPNSSGSHPWCYVSRYGPYPAWGYCNVTDNCDTGTVETGPMEPWQLCLVLVAFSIFTVLSLYSFRLKIKAKGVLYRRQSFDTNSYSPQSSASEFPSGRLASLMVRQSDFASAMLTDNHLYHQMSAHTWLSGRTEVISASSLRDVRRLAEGGFAVVSTAQYQGQTVTLKQSAEPTNRNGGKILKPSTTTDVEATGSSVLLSIGDVEQPTAASYWMLVHEACCLRRIGAHPSIITLIGVNFDQQPATLILEWMHLGDLQHYLREAAGRQRDIGAGMGLDRVDYGDRLGLPDTAQSLHLLAQIVDAVSFVIVRGWVHRDIAARNCLLRRSGASLLVKLADFGLCRALDDELVYCGSFSEKFVPVRWMSPEALDKRLFSAASDVWACGILIWEVFSAGMLPYYGLTHEQVSNLVLEQKHLTKPSNSTTTDDVYELMCACWRFDADERISPAELKDALANMVPPLPVLISK